MKSLKLVVILISLFAVKGLKAESDILMEMNILDSRYNFKMEFVTDFEPDVVTQILYDFNHLQQYLKRNMESKLLDVDSAGYLVEFSLEKFFYSYHAQFKRIIQNDKNRVDIIMQSFDQKPKNLPKVSKFEGYYLAEKLENGKTKITYVQDVELNGNGGWIYKKMVKLNLKNFADRVTEYFQELENRNYYLNKTLVVKN